MRIGALSWTAMTLLSLAEGEGIRLGARSAEGDLERPVADALALTDQLVKAAVGEQAVPGLVHVVTVRRARRLAVEEHAERNRPRPRCEHEVCVAGVEAEGDAPAGPVEYGLLALDPPDTGERPATVGLAPRAAEVRLRRSQVVPVGLGLDAGAVHANRLAVDAQQPLDGLLRLLIPAL